MSYLRKAGIAPAILIDRPGIIRQDSTGAIDQNIDIDTLDILSHLMRTDDVINSLLQVRLGAEGQIQMRALHRQPDAFRTACNKHRCSARWWSTGPC